MQFGFIQTFLAKRALEKVSELTDSEIYLDKVQVSWLDRASLANLLIKDAKQDTMVYAKEVVVNYKLQHLISGDFLSIEEVVAEEAELRLTKHDGDSKLNLTDFLRSLKRDSTNEKGGGSIRVDQINLNDFQLSVTDKTREKASDRVDFAHLHFVLPFVDLSDFELRPDTIMGVLNHFSGYDLNSELEVEELRTDFKITNESMVLNGLSLMTPSSRLTDSVKLNYDGLDDLGYFQDSVSFAFHFDDSKISSKDIAIFSGFSGLVSDLTLDGTFMGKVGDFNIDDARIGFGSSTYLRGSLSCFGLPDPAKTFILADVSDSHIEPDDFEEYLGSYTANVRTLGQIDFTGNFSGFLRDFVATGDFDTDRGAVYTDINLKIPSDHSPITYEGKLETVGLDAGSLFQNDLLQGVNLKAQIKGSGITLENADFNLTANVTNSGLNGYIYDSVYLNGDFKKNFFKTELGVVDPNCVVVGYAELDIREGREYLDADVRIANLDANAVRLTQHDISANGHLDVTVENFNVDDFVGELELDSGVLDIGGKALLLDSVRLSSSFARDSSRQVVMGLPGALVDISGNFKISDVINDIPFLAQKYAEKLHLLDTTAVNSSFLMTSENRLDAVVVLKDVSSYLDSMRIPVSISKGSSFELSYRGGSYSDLSLFFEGDSVSFYENQLIDPVVEINSSSDNQFDNILTNFIARSSSQDFRGIPTTNDLLLEGIWYGSEIGLSAILKQPSTASDVRLESQLVVSRDTIVFRFLPSDMIILDDEWKFNPLNRIVFGLDEITIHNMEIYDKSESIRLFGTISDEKQSSVSILAEDLNMDKANLFAANDFEGFLNANVVLIRESQKEGFRTEGEFFLKSLAYHGLEIGDLNGSSEWSAETRSIYSLIEVVRDDTKSIVVSGNYQPGSEDNQLDFLMNFDETDLALAAPFVEENFSNLRGTATGKAKLTGRVVQPILEGKVQIADGGGHLNYLNTEYSFAGEVSVNSEEIEANSIDLKDRRGGTALLSGVVSHTNYNDFQTDLLIQADNFEFLNTTSLDNTLYYGNAYGSGEISIEGPLNDIHIKADVISEQNTRLFIPVTESSSSSQEDFIQFRNLSDTTVSVDLEESNAIRGLTLDFDVEVTPDAYCELIFDIKKGDIIRGRGKGNLKLHLSKEGEFTMFGPLEIDNGAYNFTLSNLINKEFDVVPGGRITWYGDPYNASIDLEATYMQRASFEELKNPDERDEANLSNRVPVLAVLDVNGTMLSPEIEFGIRLRDESDANNENLTIIEGMREDDDELTRQFISLLFLKRFTPQDGFLVGGSSLDVEGSVSEILSNQVSYLISQVDENLEVEVDLATLDEQAFNTFQLRFAYTFFDGRLKVSRGGSFGRTDQQQDQNVLNNIVGDWSVEYSLTKDGRLRAKVFQNTNERLVNFNNGNFAQETGVSLRFVHSFNDFKELLNSTRREGIRRKEDEEESKQLGDNSGSNSRID